MNSDPRADLLVLDDRARPAAGPLPWRFFTDAVMGGLSTGAVSLEIAAGRPAVCLQGQVRLENNGGFIQMALDVPPDLAGETPAWQGLELDLQGNERRYGVHLRTTALALPWQSYRASAWAGRDWQRLRLPFAAFTPYRTREPFDVASLRRVGLLAIGERFEARLCVARLALYR